jgi:hypothetical protein
VIPPREGFCPGWLNFLPELYERAVENSVLRQAVLAAAYANFAQKTHNPKLSVKAMSCYLESLELGNFILSDYYEAISDATMSLSCYLDSMRCV